jgi:hypothetical protein
VKILSDERAVTNGKEEYHHKKKKSMVLIKPKPFSAKIESNRKN